MEMTCTLVACPLEDERPNTLMEAEIEIVEEILKTSFML